MKRPRHDTPEKRLLRELRERLFITNAELEARGRYVQRAAQSLLQSGMAQEHYGKLLITELGDCSCS